MKRTRRPWAILTTLSLILLLLPLPTLSATSTGDTVVVRMPAAAYDAAAVPAARALHYDTFVWLELTAAEFARLEASGRPYQVQPDPFTLTLGEQRFDPLQGGPDRPAGWQSLPHGGPDLHLVQLRGPTQAAWLAGLRESGLEIVQYIHPFTYIVWGDAAALERAGRAEYVRWTAPFAPAYRVLPQWRDLPAEPVRVNILLVRAADIPATLRELEDLGGRSQGWAILNDTFAIAAWDLPGTQFQAAARVPGVYSIQPLPTDGGLRGEMSNQINVNNHLPNNQAYPGYLAWLAAAGVNGAGVIIANVDGGIHDNHPDLANRLIPCSGQTCGGAAQSNHGTHTAGIMAGDASSGVKDSYGFYRGLGMAPGANLVEQVYSPWSSQPNGMLLLMTDSYNNGASISGNSWGPSGSAQGYDNHTMQVDIGVRDAVPDTPGNQPLSYVLSIMNGNGGYQSQGTPDEAKNIFTIGSTKMQTSGGAQILDINDLSANSAHGPALDGRTIPHLVAPGCSVDSSISTSGYALYCGTSMASPHVSGAVALFIEYYRGLFAEDPSPALIKAAFLPVAHDLAGYRDADGGIMGHPFDSKQGWGRMDTAAVVSPTVAVEYFDNPVIFDNTGEEWVQTMAAADPTKPVRLMLVWTDAYGHGLGGSTPAWNNDLDLVVEADGNTYYGNNLAGGWSQPGGSADYRNNTEGVFLGPTFAGAFTVRVVASNINSDGVPNYGDDTDQDFSLACYNCVLGADFTLRALPNTLAVCAPETVTSTIQVGQLLDYAEPVTLAVLDVPAGVTATIAPSVVTPPGEATLTLEVGPAAAAGTYTLVVSGTAEITNVHTVNVRLAISSGPPAAPTLLSPPDGATGQPLEPTLSWSPLPQVWDYSLQVDTLPTFPAPIVDVTGLPTGTYTVAPPLAPATCYYWRAMGENVCGAGDWATPFRFATVRFSQAFGDDVESGGGNWTATGLWHISTAGVDPCAEAHSGISSWYYGQESTCTYNTGGTNSGTLTLNAPVDLAGALAPATLRFWSWEQTEGASGYDTRKVYLSSNGSTWTQVWNSSNNAAAWYQVELDVSAYVDGNLYIRFEFNTVDSMYNNYRGWYVDDIEVIAGLPSADPPTLTSITPDAGWSDEPTPVVIEGSGFAGTPAVKLGDAWLLAPTLVSSTTLEAVVPAGLAGGVYDLTLYNGSDCGEAVLLDAFTVLVECITPTGELASDSPVTLGEPMYFTATVAGTAPLSYTWDLGDGTVIAGPAALSHTYATAGAFTVTLTVENPCGTLVLTATVAVLCDPPTGDWVSDSPVTLGEAMHLTATVTGTGPLTYSWDLGDGLGWSAEPHLVYTYTASGHFTVTLTVGGPCGVAAFTGVVEVRPLVVYHTIYLPLVLKAAAP